MLKPVMTRSAVSQKMSREQNKPFVYAHKEMVISKSKSEDAVSQVVPVNDDFASSNPCYKLYNEERRKARGILAPM